MDVLEELIEDIYSWDAFYIISDGESLSVVEEFSKTLDALDVDYSVINDVGSFSGDLNTDNSLLAISNLGEEELIVESVKFAKFQGVKVYVMCGDDKGSLASLADELIGVGENFNESLKETIAVITDKLKEESDKAVDIFVPSRQANIMKAGHPVPFNYFKIKGGLWIIDSIGNGVIFIFSDEEFKDIAFKLSDKLQSLGATAFAVDDDLKDKFRKIDFHMYNYVTLASGKRHKITKSDGFIVISKSCEEEYIKDVASFTDCILCGENKSGVSPRGEIIIRDVNNFREDTMAFIENLRIRDSNKFPWKIVIVFLIVLMLLGLACNYLLKLVGL